MGTQIDGTEVTQALTTAPPAGTLSSYVFSDAFPNVVSVRYRGRDFGEPITNFLPVVDDVTLRTSTVTPVPEPSALQLVAGGSLATGGAVLRRRRSAARPVADRVRQRGRPELPIPPAILASVAEDVSRGGVPLRISCLRAKGESRSAPSPAVRRSVTA